MVVNEYRRLRDGLGNEGQVAGYSTFDCRATPQQEIAEQLGCHERVGAAKAGGHPRGVAGGDS